MTAADVIARMRALGVRVLTGPRLDFPKDILPDAREFVIVGAREFRDEVLAAFPPEPPRITWEGQCEVCRALVTVWDGQADEVYRMCRMREGSLACPYWNERVAAPWEKKARSDAMFKARRQG